MKKLVKKQRKSFKQFLKDMPKLSSWYLEDPEPNKSSTECCILNVDVKGFKKDRENYFKKYPFYTWLAKLLKKI